MRCPYCHGPFADVEARWRCPSCATVHHRACAREGEACAVFGCAEPVSLLPSSVPLRAERSGWEWLGFADGLLGDRPLWRGPFFTIALVAVLGLVICWFESQRYRMF